MKTQTFTASMWREKEVLTMKVHEFTFILTADPNEEEADLLYSIAKTVPYCLPYRNKT